MGFFKSFFRAATAFTTGGLSEVARSAVTISQGDLKEGLATLDLGVTSPLTVLSTETIGAEKTLVAKSAFLGAGVAGALETSVITGAGIGAAASGVTLGVLTPQQAAITGLGSV